MSRYHYNKEGNVGPCSATEKCPFGIPVDDHYLSEEAARHAYEVYVEKTKEEALNAWQSKRRSETTERTAEKVKEYSLQIDVLKDAVERETEQGNHITAKALKEQISVLQGKVDSLAAAAAKREQHAEDVKKSRAADKKAHRTNPSPVRYGGHGRASSGHGIPSYSYSSGHGGHGR